MKKWLESPKFFLHLRNLSEFPITYNCMHAEKRSVKFTGSSVLIWTTWLFSKFYKKLSSINRFSVQYNCVQYNQLNSDFFVFSRFYWTLSETYRKFVNWTQLLVKFTEKSCFPNKYRTSRKFYGSFLCVWSFSYPEQNFLNFNIISRNCNCTKLQFMLWEIPVEIPNSVRVIINSCKYCKWS